MRRRRNTAAFEYGAASSPLRVPPPVRGRLALPRRISLVRVELSVAAMVELREGKMAELEVSVPLAKFDTDEWAEFSDFQSSQDTNCNPTTPNTTGTTPEKNDNDFLDNMSDTTENFKDTFSTSLEDLVNCFDDKITKCFCNYEDKVEKYAPVQVRTQEEIMNDCQ